MGPAEFSTSLPVPPMTPRLIRSDRWTAAHVAAAVGMAAVGVAVTWPAWADIYHIATTDEESDHILLVPLVAVWMLWARRMRFRYCRPSDTALGPLIVAVGWLARSYGYYHGVQSFWHGGSVLVVLGCVVSVLGKQAIFRFLPVVAVLVFLVPVPGRGPAAGGPAAAELDGPHRAGRSSTCSGPT